MKKVKSYHLYYSKEEKTDEKKITVGSYARDIANEVFIRLSSDEFMAKVHERMALDEKTGMENQSAVSPPPPTVCPDEKKEMINAMAINNAMNRPSIGASL